MSEKNSGILEVLNSNTSSSLMDSQIQDSKLEQQEQSFGFDVSQQPEPKQNSFGIKLTSEEEQSRETGTTQFTGGVIRVSDSSTALEDTDFKSAKALYESTLGVTQYDSLRAKIGLKDGESYTDYYNRTGYVPAGFEMEAKLLLAEEKRKKLYMDYQAGKTSETDFLYNAYGKDIMKAEGHDLSSTLYWYQRRKSGKYDSPLDNDTYLAGVIAQARQQFQAEEWFEKSQTATLNNTLASYVTGEVLDATKLREIFPEETFAELDKYYDSTERIIDLYRSGLLSGFNPTIDIDEDGKVDYYYHTDGKLYAIDGSSGDGAYKAYAHYNKDGSLNRVTLTGSEFGEITQQFIKGFSTFVTDTLGFVGMVGGGLWDLFEGITGQGWDLSATTQMTINHNKWLNQSSFFGNDGFIVDSGLKTSDGNTNWMGIWRGVANAGGTIAGFVASAGIGSAVTSVASKGSMLAMKGGKKVAIASIKEGVESASQALVSTSVKKGVKELVGEASEKLIKEAVEEVSEEFVKKGVAEVTENQIKNALVNKLKTKLGTSLSTKSMLALKESAAAGLKHTVSSRALQGVATFTNVATKLTGMSNGAPITKWAQRSAMALTAESVGILAVKDYLSTATNLYAQKEQLGLSDGDIMLRSLGVTALNAGISFAFRSTMDKSALTRWAEYSEGIASKGKKISELVAKGEYASSFASKVNSWILNHPKSFLAVSTGMDIFENMSTAYFSSSVSQSGKLFDAETFRSTFSNPQFLAAQLFSGISTIKGGLSTTSEGIETGNIIKTVGDVTQIANETISRLKKAAAETTRPEDSQAILDVIKAFENDIKSFDITKGETVLTGYTKALSKLHDMLNTDGESVVKDVVKDQFNKNVRTQTLAEMRFAAEYYNKNIVELPRKVAKNTLLGKLGIELKGKKQRVLEYTRDILKANFKNLTDDLAIGKAYYIHSSGETNLSSDAQAILEKAEIRDLKSFFTQEQDGSFKVEDSFFKSNPEEAEQILKALNEGQLDINSLEDGFIIHIPGVGSDVEGQQGYKEVLSYIKFLRQLLDKEAEESGETKKVLFDISKGGKGDTFFVPSLGLGEAYTYKLLNNIGETVRLIHAIRYAPSSSVRLETLKSFHQMLIDNDPKTIVPGKNDLPALLIDLYKHKLITAEQAADLYDELDVKTKASIDKRLKDNPDELKDLNNFSDYSASRKLLEDLEDLAFVNRQKMSESELNNLKSKFNELKSKPKIKDQLIKDGFITEKMFKSLEDFFENPQSSQDWLKELSKSLRLSGVNGSTKTKDVIKFISNLIDAPEKPGAVPAKLGKKSLKKHAVGLAVGFFNSDDITSLSLKSLGGKAFQKKIDKYCVDNNLDATQVKADIDKTILAAKVDLLTKLKENHGIVYEGLKREFLEKNNLTGTVMDEDEILKNISESKDFGDLYDKHTKPKSLVDRANAAVEEYNKLYEGTEDVEAAPYVMLDFTTLTGKLHSQLIRRLSNPYIRSTIASANTDEEIIKIIFGDKLSVNQVRRGLDRERKAMEALRKHNPLGYRIYSRESDMDELNKLFNRLGYEKGFIEATNRENPVSGVYHKTGTDKALAFSLAQKEFNDLNKTLLNKLGYNINTQTSQKKVQLDVATQLHNFIGGLTYLDDNTVLSPTVLLYSSLDLSDENISFTTFHAVQDIYDAAGKQGKIAGALRNLIGFASPEFGMKSKRNKDLREYEILLHSIDVLADFLDSNIDKDFAISKVFLTDDEFKDYETNGLWKLTKVDDEAPSGTKAYIIEPKRNDDGSRKTGNQFKDEALALLKDKGKVNLNYIVPCYNVDANGDNVILTGSFKLNDQTTLGYSPIVKVIAEGQNKYQADEVVDLFRNQEFDNKYNKVTQADRDAVLKFFTGTVGEIKTKLQSVPAELNDNPYFLMMRNAFEASLKISDYITTNSGELSDISIKLLVDKRHRNFIAHYLQAHYNESDEEIAKGIRDLVSAKGFDLNNQSMSPQLKEDFFEYQDTIDKDSATFSGAQAYLFNVKRDNLLQNITSDDIALLKSVVEYERTIESTVTESKSNAFVKLYNMINSSKESSLSNSGNLHIYMEDLFGLTEQEFNEIKTFLGYYLSEKDIKLLEDKFELIKQTDTYQNVNSLDIVEEQRLENTTGTEATLTHLFNAIGKNMKDPAVKQSIEFAENYLKTNKQKPKVYKVSQLDALKNNRESTVLQKLGILLQQKLFPGINRRASLLIQNLELKESLGQFISSISSLAEAYENHFRVELGKDDNGKDIVDSLPPDFAINLAFATYAYSTGVDYQNEWTKYLIVDMNTGEIVNTAQQMAGYKSANDILDTMNKILDADHKRGSESNYMIINLEKNMMLSNTVASDKLTYMMINDDVSKNNIRTLWLQNGLAQFESNTYLQKRAKDYKVEVDTNVKKAAFVYASTPSIKDTNEDIINSFVELGVDRKMAELAVYHTYEDLQFTSSNNNASTQQFINTFSLFGNKKDRTKLNGHYKKMNDVFKYQVTYDGLSNTQQQTLKDKMREAKQPNGILSYTTQSSKEFKTKIKIEEGTLLPEEGTVLPKGTTIGNITLKKDSIIKSIDTSTGEITLSNLVYKSIKHYEDVIEAVLKGDDEGLKDALTTYRLKNKDVSEEQLTKALLYTYLYSSKEASALSFLFTGNDYDYLKGLRDTDFNYTVKFKGQDIQLKSLLQNGEYVLDIEAFYNDSKDTSPFQIALNKFDANGNLIKREPIYIPVYFKGSLITTEAQLAEAFPTFYNEYFLKNKGTRKAVEEYFTKAKTLFADKEPSTKFDLESEISKYIDDTSLPIIGYNTKEYDNTVLEKVGLVKQDSVLLTNSVDIYNDVFKKVITLLDLTNKESLQEIASRLDIKEELAKYGVSLDEAHDAYSDTVITYVVAKHIIDNTVDLHNLRQDLFDDINTIGKAFLGDTFNSDNVKDILTSQEFKLNPEDIPSNYKERFTNIENLKGNVLAMRKLQASYLSQEREARLRGYYQDYNTTFNRVQREIVDLLKTKDVSNKLNKVLNYIKNVKGYTTISEAANALAVVMPKYFGINNNFKEKDFLKFLNSSAEDILTLVSKDLGLTFNKDSDDFKNASSSINAKEIVEAKTRMNNGQGINAISNSLRESDLIYTYNKHNESLSKSLQNDFKVGDNDLLDSDIINHLLEEANTFYLDTNLDADTTKRFLKRKKIRDSLTERELEFLKQHPARNIKINSLYRLVQSIERGEEIKTLTASGHYETSQARSNTIYVSQDVFKKLTNMDYTTACAAYNSDTIYITVIRQPLDKVDAVQNYIVKVTNDPTTNVKMSPDTLRALHGGDFDGDHVTLIKPSRLTQEFARGTLDYTKASWNLFDNLIAQAQPKGRTTSPSILMQIKAMNVLGTPWTTGKGKSKRVHSIRQDLEELVNFRANYNNLYEDRLQKLMNDLKVDKDTAKELMKVAWILPGPEVKDISDIENTQTYYSHSMLLAEDKLNLSQQKAIKDFHAIQRGVNAESDISTGLTQKSFAESVTEITGHKKLADLMNRAGFTLADGTIDYLNAAFKSDEFKKQITEYFRELIKSDNKLSDNSKKLLTNRVINDTTDLLIAMKIYEERVTQDNNEHLTNALLKLNTSFEPDKTAELDEYTSVLKNYLQSSVDLKDKDFFKIHESLSDMLDAVLDDDSDDYFETGSYDSDYANALLNHKLEEVRQHNKSKSFNTQTLDEFKNKVDARILYVLNPSVPMTEDTMYLGPASENQNYYHITTFKLSNDEILNIKNKNKPLKAGKDFSSTRQVPKELDGYYIINYDETTGNIILAKNKKLDGTTKLTIAGSASTKGTIKGKASEKMLSMFDEATRKSIFAVANMSEFNIKKMSSDTKANLKFKYYNANGVETKDATKAAYVLVDTYMGVAEDTAYWNTDLKETLVDNVTVGNNQRSYEAQILLKNYSLKFNDDGTLTFDNSLNVKLNQAFRKSSSPRYLNNNGMYVYKSLLLATLLSKSGMPIEKQKDTLRRWIQSKELIGNAGTSFIHSLLKNIKDLATFKQGLSPLQQGLFDERLLTALFNLSPEAISQNTEKQASKKSYGSYLKQVVGLYAPKKYAGGYNAIQGNIRSNGKEIHSLADSYISMLDLRNILNSYANPDSYYRLSPSNAEELTRYNITNLGKGYATTYNEKYNPADARFVVETDGIRGTNTNRKSGTEVLQLTLQDGTSVYITVPTEDLQSNIKLSNTSTIRPKSSLNFEDSNKLRAEKFLLEALDNKRDDMSIASGLFLAKEQTDANIAMHRNPLRVKDNNIVVTNQPISTYKRASLFDYYKVLNTEYSSAQYISNSNDIYSNRVKELDLDNPNSDFYKIYKNEKMIAKAMPDSYELAINKHIQVIQDASYMPKDYYEGREDYLNTIYKTDSLESGNIKLDSEAALNAERTTKYYKTTGESIKLILNTKLTTLYSKTKSLGITEEFNEYAFLVGTLDRIERLRTSKKNAYTKQDTIDIAISSLIKLLPDGSEESARAKINNFKHYYGNIANDYDNFVLDITTLAKQYSKLTLEPSDKLAFLLVPNLHSKEGAAQRAVFETELLHQDANYTSYVGYNFFKSVPELIADISKKIGIYDGAQTFKREGYMDNEIVLNKVNTFFDSEDENGKTMLTRFTELHSDQASAEYNFNQTMLIMINEFDNFQSRYQKTLVSLPKHDTLGSKYVAVYLTLQSYREDAGISYSEARQLLNDTDISKANLGITVAKACEYSNDVLANLCCLTPQGKNLIAELGKQIYNGQGNLVAVDRYGRKITKNVTEFKRLSHTSLEYVPDVLKYYLGNEDDFFTALAFDAINGDIYYMPKTLADNLDTMIFNTPVPKGIKKHLIKVQNLAVKLLMSSPFKLIDRLLKFTGFDLSALSFSAGPKLLLKQGKARTDLAALYSSKGAILSDSSKYGDLKEFLYSQGIDPNNANFEAILQGEINSDGLGPSFSNAYFDATNRMFTYQTLFERYAAWLSLKEDFQKGKGSYGSMYHKKELVDQMNPVYRETNFGTEEVVSKAGNQASFIVAQTLGSPGDFPALAKRLNGYATFITFPLALLRWGKHQAFSTATAFKNLFVEGETKGALKQLGYSGGGILGVYLTTNLIISLISEMFGVDEEQEEEWKEEQAVPDVFKTLIQGTPIMDTYSSINPVHELGELTINPVIKPMLDDDEETTMLDGLKSWFLKNIVSHTNPAVKGGVETLTGYDLIGDSIIPAKTENGLWDNFLRKASAYVIGSAGANAYFNYKNSYEALDDNPYKKISTGLSRAVNAELGNTKVHKSNQKNYYKAMSLVNNYIYKDKDSSGLGTSSDNFNSKTYKSIKNDLTKALTNKAKATDIYAIINSYIEEGASYQEIKSALNNSSIAYKLSRMNNQEDFISSLTESELTCLKSAIAYEDYIFPWLDDIIDELNSDYNQYNSKYVPRIYLNNYNYYNNNNYSKNYNNNYYSKINKPFNSYQDYRDVTPIDIYEDMMNSWKYGKATDLYGNKYTGYTNIKGDTWTYGGNK